MDTKGRENPRPADGKSEADCAALFRSPALAAARHRGLGPVRVITAPSAAATLWAATLATVCLGASLVLIELPERARAVGLLVPAGGLVKVRAPRAGRVERLAVGNGTRVVAGDSLAWLGSTGTLPDRGPVAALHAASLRRELNAGEALLDTEISAAAARRDGLRQRVRLLRERLLIARQEFATRTEKARLEKHRALRMDRLAADGRLARQASDDADVVALAAAADGFAARQRALALEAEIMAATAQIESELRYEAQQRAAQAARREGLLRDLTSSELRSVEELRAPAAGVVAGVLVRAGSAVRPGQTLMTIYDRDAPLEAQLFVAADSAAFLRPGQSVELRLRAYPHQTFGTVPAVVADIGAIAMPAQEFDVAVPIAGPVFEIRAKLADPAVTAFGDRWVLPPGTLIEADLIRRRWPLYGWLFRALGDRLARWD